MNGIVFYVTCVNINDGKASWGSEFANKGEDDLKNNQSAILSALQKSGQDAENAWENLTEAENGSASPTVHYEDAEQIARDLDQNREGEVRVWIAAQGSGSKRETIVTHGYRKPLKKIQNNNES